MEQPGVVAGNFALSFSLNFLSIFVHISGTIRSVTLIWVSMERCFPPAKVEYRWYQFWSKGMTSEVEERPMLITAGYGWHGSQWVNPALEQCCPWSVFNKLTWHEPVIQLENQHLVCGQLHKNMWTQWAVNLSPQYGTGQQTPCFIRCLLIIAGVQISKKYTVKLLCKPRLNVSFLENGRHVGQW